MTISLQSWGRTKTSLCNPVNQLDFNSSKTNLVVGSCLSYGDSCLNSNGNVYFSKYEDNILEFSRELGIIRCEAGITFDALLKFLVPTGHFLPVTPGTKFITLGGAVANDIHGKNHHKAGTFGNWILSLGLQRSDGVFTCSRESNVDLFKATIGGLGLTGRILWVEFKVIPIKSSNIVQKIEKFTGLEEYIEINSKNLDADYTVAWLDCFYKGKEGEIGRGLYISGNFANDGQYLTHNEPRLNVPIDFPSCVLNKKTIKAFNLLYYNKQLEKHHESIVHYDSFFYPLDSILSWNKIYGKRGFFQFQCVLPLNTAKEAMKKILKHIELSGQGSFLSVLKNFGDIVSPGHLSFPYEGLTLCLDIPNQENTTEDLFRKLYDLVGENGGRIYPAKDSFMSSLDFSHFENYQIFKNCIDPKFNSDFYLRVKG